MKESKTTYSYLIEHMQNPSFQKVWDIAYDFVRKLPGDLCDELHESLNRGVDVLDSEPLLQMYIYSFGKMHNAKLQYAFEHLHENVIKYKEIEIVDYGCGQGLATICYHDFILGWNSEQQVKRITLIEPSLRALSRAELLCSRFYPNAEIVAINKQFDNLLKEDLVISSQIPTIHIFSNILDVESFDITHFSQIVKEDSIGDNEYIMVSPMQNPQRTQRLKTFASTIDRNPYFEQYLEKRQLDSEKDWTCAVLLCTNTIHRNIIELDCNNVFEDARMFYKKKEKNLNSDCCHELFSKLLVCAKEGDMRCQNLLGSWYLKGIGTAPDHNLAIEWYFKSAMQGYDSAYKNIVTFCDLDDMDGTGRPYERVFKYFENVAHKGDAEDKYFFALCYYYGIGVDMNDELAFYWFNESAKQGNDEAIHALGECYLEGECVDKNIEKAILFFTQSAKLGNITSIKNIIQLFRKKIGIEYFGDEQYDIIVKAAQNGMQDVIPVLNEDGLTISSLFSLDQDYSFERIYNSLQKMADNWTENASFVFKTLKHLSLPKTKILGFLWRREDDYNDDMGNSLFPYVYDSTVNARKLLIEDESNIPSDSIIAQICKESFWEVFLLDNLEFFMPKTDHYCYLPRHIVFSPDNNILPKEIIDYLQESPIDFNPKIDCLFNKIIRVQCIYYNAWKGLAKWYDYYLFQEISDGKMKVTRLNSISNQTNLLYKYDCGDRF